MWFNPENAEKSPDSEWCDRRIELVTGKINHEWDQSITDLKMRRKYWFNVSRNWSRNKRFDYPVDQSDVQYYLILTLMAKVFDCVSIISILTITWRQTKHHIQSWVNYQESSETAISSLKPIWRQGFVYSEWLCVMKGIRPVEPSFVYTNRWYALRINQWACSFGMGNYQDITTISWYGHQQKIYPSGRNGSVKVDVLRQSYERQPGSGLLRAQSQFNASLSISSCDCWFTISSRFVGLLFYTITLALWVTVTIRQNGFIGYALASGL